MRLISSLVAKQTPASTGKVHIWSKGAYTVLRDLKVADDLLATLQTEFGRVDELPHSRGIFKGKAWMAYVVDPQVLS